MRTSITLLLAATLIAACSLVSRPPGAPQPAMPCVERFSRERCEAIEVAAAEQLGVALDAITAIEIAPDPTPRVDGELVILGGGRGLGLLVHVGSEVHEVALCGGLPSGPACMDAPALEISSVTAGGYRDVPCAGEGPEGCATPLASVDPAALAEARPLLLDRRTIPIDHVGQHEVVLGRATLPNGILTSAEARLVDPWPDGVRVSGAGLFLDVRSLDPDRPPLRNYYEHGWWPGVEEVEVVLVFEVLGAEPGAALELADVVVR